MKFNSFAVHSSRNFKVLQLQISYILIESDMDCAIADFNMINCRIRLWFIHCYGNRNLNVECTIICSDCRCASIFCFNNTVYHFSYAWLGTAPNRFLSDINVSSFFNTRKHDLTCGSYCGQSKFFRCINYASYTCVRCDYRRCSESTEINIIYINYSVADCTCPGELGNGVNNQL
ncbi:hypothetical protein D1872_228190 [compost metagenome]